MKTQEQGIINDLEALAFDNRKKIQEAKKVMLARGGAPRAGADDYPGQDCWANATIAGLMNYNALCRTTIAGTYGDVIMFNAGAVTPTVNTASGVAGTWGICYTMPTNTGSTKPGIWLNLNTNGSEGNYSFVRDDYGMHFEHSVTIRFPQRSPSFQTFISSIPHGAFKFVLANRDGGVLASGDTPDATHYNQTFQMYGNMSGLVLSAINASTDLSNGHAAEVTFASLADENLVESFPPITLWNATSGAVSSEQAFYTATKTAILSWVTLTTTTSEDLVNELNKRNTVS